MGRPRNLASLFVGSLLVLALAGGGSSLQAAWDWYPWLSVGAGHESDLVLDPDLDRTVVPGGGFADLSGGAMLISRTGAGSRLALSGRTSLERFFNSDDRLLWGGALRAELTLRSTGPWQFRTALGGAYFRDSERETVERLDGGAEGALGYGREAWRLELLTRMQGRRYPELATLDEVGQLGTYTEGSASLGLAVRLRPSADWLIDAEASRTGTDARDPAYDGEAWFWQGSLWWRPLAETWLGVLGMRQTRDFTSADLRPVGEDSDSYWQVGLGVERGLGRGLSLSARYARSRYSWPTGATETTERVAIALSWRPPVRGLPAVPTFPVPDKSEDLHLAGEPIVFRFRAPDAHQVALVGDFNGWDPASDIMDRHQDGRWQLARALPAGHHLYAYWVDGRIVTPPEAMTTVDDGFGGRNGLLRVLAGEL